MAHLINREQWAEKPDAWHGEFQGGAFGADVSVVFFSSDKVGGGPKLHTHPYPEVFIVRVGRALFTVGDETIEAEAGQILVASQHAAQIRQSRAWTAGDDRPACRRCLRHDLAGMNH